MTRVLRETRRFMVNWRGTGIVAVSGGADSVALLRALRACRANCLVAHVNHQLRGEESDGDEQFVRELCATLGIECRVTRADVAALATSDNLESTARRVRYDFFAEVAREVNATWIATAHTADDQAETVLHRLIRGTGLQGLRGIARTKPATATANTSETATPHIIRPLLAVTRDDVIAHLAEIRQPYRTDSTNADTRFTRNRIRHELLPLLRSFNPDVVNALAHVAEHANEAHAIITGTAAELLAKVERPRVGGTVVLDAMQLGDSRVLIRALLRLVWEREGWPLGDMTFDAWDRAVDVACRNAGATDFPGGITMRYTGRVVQLGKREPSQKNHSHSPQSPREDS